MTRDSPDESPADKLLKMLGGKWVTASVCAFAELGLPELLAQGPVSVSELAARSGTDAANLARLIAVLVGLQVVARAPDDAVRLTDVGLCLTDGALGDLARYVGSEAQWRPFGHLAHAVKTGESAFELAHGAPLFEYLASHPADSDRYDRGVDAFTRETAAALCRTTELPSGACIVDVGGGRGSLLVELAKQLPESRGILFDLPHVVEGAEARFAAAGLGERLSVVGGDFRTAVPQGADVYVIKHVLHNWDDDQALALLRRCVASMPPDAVVLVVEGVLLPGDILDGTRLMDVEMMALFGRGHERSKQAFRALFRDAGLSLVASRPLIAGTRVLVGRRRGV